MSSLGRTVTVALLVWLGLSFAANSASAAQAPHVAPARAAARAPRLFDTAAWRRLLHVHPTSQHGWEAEPDGPAFFLSDRGTFDPEAEMLATIEALYLPASRGDSHALCMFPARARFLEDFLHLDDLPRPACAARDAFFAHLRPNKVLFVFSSYHVESPASAFGHVLLRVERDDSGILRKDAGPHTLADLGIDYSADVGAENAISYAFKGLFGQFRGTFKAMPYAAKVREYQDFEARDLWEYELSLTSDEKRMFLEHLWELGQTSFDYFYATENCAYHVLALLDVVRPEAHLLAALSRPVIPADALAAVWSAKGLVARVRFRPSARRAAAARLAALASDERLLAEALAKVPGRPEANRDLARLSLVARARVLDAAADLLDVAHPELLAESTSESPARTRKFELLAMRAALDVRSPELDVPAPEGAAPHLAHGARRVALGTGYGSMGGAFLEARARLSMHDLLDPSHGLPPLATLEILEVRARAYASSRSVALERLTLVQIEKLAPLGTLDGGLSYRFFLGGDRVRDHGCSGCFVAKIDIAMGAATELVPGALVFARGGLTLEAGPNLDGLDGRAFRVGTGPSAGARLRLGERLVALGEGRVAWLPGASRTFTAEAMFETRLELSHAVSLGFFLRRALLSADLGVSGLFYF